MAIIVGDVSPADTGINQARRGTMMGRLSEPVFPTAAEQEDNQLKENGMKSPRDVSKRSIPAPE